MNLSSFYALAVAAAFYPLLLATVVLFLPRPRSMALLVALLAGCFTATMALGIVIITVVGSTSALSGSSNRTVSPAVNIAIGVILLYAAAVIFTERDVLFRRRQPKAPKPVGKSQSWRERAGTSDSLLVAFGLGIALDLPSVWFLAALKDLIEGKYSTTEQILLLISYALIVYAAVEIPIILKIIWPDKVERMVKSADVWMKAHSRALGGGIAGILGVWQLATGIANLV